VKVNYFSFKSRFFVFFLLVSFLLVGLVKRLVHYVQ
jgi:hypothetical protein